MTSTSETRYFWSETLLTHSPICNKKKRIAFPPVLFMRQAFVGRDGQGRLQVITIVQEEEKDQARSREGAQDKVKDRSPTGSLQALGHIVSAVKVKSCTGTLHTQQRTGRRWSGDGIGRVFSQRVVRGLAPHSCPTQETETPKDRPQKSHSRSQRPQQEAQ